jgi:hypothetical protein
MVFELGQATVVLWSVPASTPVPSPGYELVTTLVVMFSAHQLGVHKRIILISSTHVVMFLYKINTRLR